MKISAKIVALLLASGAITGSASAAPLSFTDKGTDVAMTAKVQHEIDATPILSAAGVRAEAVDGTIYIRGLVDTFQQKSEAEDIVRGASKSERILNLVDVSNAAG